MERILTMLIGEKTGFRSAFIVFYYYSGGILQATLSSLEDFATKQSSEDIFDTPPHCCPVDS